MKKGFLIIVALVLVVLIGFLVWSDNLRPGPSEAPAAENQLEAEGLPANPTEELDSINLEDLEDEFQGIDADLNNL